MRRPPRAAELEGRHDGPSAAVTWEVKMGWAWDHDAGEHGRTRMSRCGWARRSVLQWHEADQHHAASDMLFLTHISFKSFRN
jgi:hypothetical protein